MSVIKELKYTISNEFEENDSEVIKLKVCDNKAQQMYLIHKSLTQQINNNRIKKANTKTRSEVRGGGRKPWKQKGTGRARAGSNRSPLWKGGGVIFGPKTQHGTRKINKKERRLAINTMILNKFSQTIVTEKLLDNVSEPKTKVAISKMNKIGVELGKHKRVLLVVEKKTKIINLSFRNIKNVEIVEAHSINILSLLKTDIVIVTKDALRQINNLD